MFAFSWSCICQVVLDRSQSLLNFVPQEKILTVKLARLVVTKNYDLLFFTDNKNDTWRLKVRRVAMQSLKRQWHSLSIVGSQVRSDVPTQVDLIGQTSASYEIQGHMKSASYEIPGQIRCSNSSWSDRSNFRLIWNPIFGLKKVPAYSIQSSPKIYCSSIINVHLATCMSYKPVYWTGRGE